MFTYDQAISFAIGFLVGVLLLAFALYVTPTDYFYKRGQIDCLTGQVKYELVTLDDSTRVWEKKK